MTFLSYGLFYIILPSTWLWQNIRFTNPANEFFLLTVFILLFNLIIYLLAYKTLDFNKVNYKRLFLCFAFINLFLILLRPVTSTDLFSYIYQGRIFSVHHLNPYLISYNQVPQDIFYKWLSNKWTATTAPYGPLFMLIAGGLSFIGQKSLILSVLLFKALFIGANIMVGYLIYKLTNLKTFFLYAFNPLIIFEFAINGHNDILAILLVILSFYFVLQKADSNKNHLIAFGFLILSSLIKYITLIFWPIFWLIAIYQQKESRNRWVFAGLSIILAGILTITFYLPFLGDWAIIWQPFIKQARLTGIYSIFILLASKTISQTLFFVSYLTTAILVLINRHKLTWPKSLGYFIWPLTLFYLTFFTWLMPWYFTLLIALLILATWLSNKRIYEYLIYSFTFYGIIYYIVLR